MGFYLAIAIAVAVGVALVAPTWVLLALALLGFHASHVFFAGGLALGFLALKGRKLIGFAALGVCVGNQGHYCIISLLPKISPGSADFCDCPLLAGVFVALVVVIELANTIAFHGLPGLGVVQANFHALVFFATHRNIPAIRVGYFVADGAGDRYRDSVAVVHLD